MLEQRTLFSPFPPEATTGLGGKTLSAVSTPLCLLGSLAALLAPALWNGHALIFYDTAGYMEAAMNMRQIPGRSLFYGLFLGETSLGWWSLWGPVLIQSLATLWLIHLVLRCHLLPSGPPVLLLTMAGLSGVTGIAWYTSQLMPDILLPLAVLGLWLFGFHWPRLDPLERLLVGMLTLLGLLSHMSCLALAMGLVLVILAARLVGQRMRVDVFLFPPAALVLTSLLLMPLLHLALTGQGGYTPGGPIFLFGRLVQDGMAKRWLSEHCPAPGIKLCDLRHRLPATADEFLWTGQSPFQNLGGWQGGAEPELKQLTLAAVRSYPAMALETTLRLTGQQLLKVGTGDMLDEEHLDARGYIVRNLPQVARSFQQARQQQDEIPRSLFDQCNRLHVPVALISVFSLLPLSLMLFRRRRQDLAALALFIFLALLGNAFICGALSNPHDRYQSRLVWLAPLVVGMAALAYRQQRMAVR